MLPSALSSIYGTGDQSLADLPPTGVLMPADCTRLSRKHEYAPHAETSVLTYATLQLQ